MKYAALFFAGTLFIAALAQAQQPLGDQIDAVKSVQDQREAAERALRLDQEQEITRKEKVARAAAATEWKRKEEYQDKLRDFQIQERTLELEERKARAARTNEFIDQELKQKAAVTDVIQSNAEVNRNISQGAKTYLEKTGEAEIKKAAPQAIAK